MILLKKIFRWLPGCLFLFLASCKNAPDKYPTPDTATLISDSLKIVEAFAEIRQSQSIVQTGDLIMRTGNDFTSDVMRKLSSKDKTYSHGGVASFENDSLFVYHAMGGEWNPDKKIRRDPFELFCNPYENEGFGVFRYLLSDKQKALFLTRIKKNYDQGILFDMKFDLATDDKMYCTEYIYKALDQILPIPSTIYKGIKFIAPDNLYSFSACSPIQQIDF